MSAQPNLPTSLPTPLTHLPTNSGERSRTLTITKYQKHGYFSTSSATMANKCEHRVWRRGRPPHCCLYHFDLINLIINAQSRGTRLYTRRSRLLHRSCTDVFGM